MIQTTCSILNAAGLDRLMGRRYRGIGAIYTLHSVVRDRKPFLEAGIHTSAAFLDLMLARHAEKDTDVISLDDAMRRLGEKDCRRFAVYTFDDGYRDNLEIALPIFEKYGKPFTVFVTSGMVLRSLNYWWGCVREVIKRHDSIDVEIVDQRFETETFEQKVKVFRRLEQMARMDLTGIPLALEVLARRYGVHSADLLDEEALSENDVRVLARHPLVEIGGHTMTHRRLAGLPVAEAKAEIVDNKDHLETLTDRDVDHFAYPHGDRGSCGPREFELVASLGFKTAATTRRANLFSEHLSSPMALPRLHFGRHETVRFMECQESGFLTAVLTRFGDPVVTL